MAEPARRSPELEAITQRWMSALLSSRGETMVNLLAPADPLIFCGTAEGEFHTGDDFRATYLAHLKEIPTGRMIDSCVEAWERGETGWAYWHGTLEFTTTQRPIPTRVTLIFAMYDGIWRVEHIHNSFPVANQEALGYEHTAHDALLEEARKLDPQVGSSGSATVMFTDIADSSAIAEAVGDTRWSRVVQAHVEMVRKELESRGGRLIKSLGDGTMSTFPSAGQAMLSALDIQAALDVQAEEPRLRVRIGLHTGDVVQAGDDFFGTVVNKAARIAAFARPGEIRVSEATRIMVGGAAEFGFSDPARVALKGLEGEHAIYRLEPGR